LTGTAALPTITASAVTYNKIQNVSATDKVLGRVSAGEGVVEEISTTGSGNVVRATSPTLVTPAIKGSSTGVTTIASANSSTGNFTLTLPAATGTFALTNSLTSRTSNEDMFEATPSGTSLFNFYTITGQTSPLIVNAPTGSVNISDGNSLVIKITALGGAPHTITWNTIYRQGDIILPTNNDKTMIIQFMYNFNLSKWDVVALSTNIVDRT
jgi:hypothetical protein